MSTQTFEDKLLNELKREVLLAPGAPEEAARARRRVTPRRAVLATAAVGAAAAAAVALPASTGSSAAYAIHKHRDGSITLTLHELLVDRAEQHELAERLRSEGVRVSFDELKPGYHCGQRRGNGTTHILLGMRTGPTFEEPTGRPTVTEAEPAREDRWKIRLSPGDYLGFENEARDGGKLTMRSFFTSTTEPKPCKPVPDAPAPPEPRG
ncbi:hypothetical protein [Streptomyces boncukensis]|uniref:Uncharacterized protein n=1 Tax=Streptomyces boncukensis TaxID=2711219 RepID=A0A6G4X4D5_9ACTN|nr:hypothetical protein [Streptomyces boncukensis]NGO72399.1 hypothetical protein [Streptomyces boncukensis]